MKMKNLYPTRCRFFTHNMNQEYHIHDKLKSVWQQWPRAHNSAATFQSWIKSEYGFTYVGADVGGDSFCGRIAVVEKIIDEKKFMWFLLKY